MPFQERNTIASLLTGFSVMTLLSWKLLSLYQAGRFDGGDALEIWARTILTAVILGIVAIIAVTILMSLLWAVATREPKPSFVTDERDRQFEIRALRISSGATGIGFVIGMIALATGTSALAALTIVFYAFVGGDFVGNIYRLCLYRTGSA